MSTATENAITVQGFEVRLMPNLVDFPTTSSLDVYQGGTVVRSIDLSQPSDSWEPLLRDLGIWKQALGTIMEAREEGWTVSARLDRSEHMPKGNSALKVMLAMKPSGLNASLNLLVRQDGESVTPTAHRFGTDLVFFDLRWYADHKTGELCYSPEHSDASALTLEGSDDGAITVWLRHANGWRPGDCPSLADVRHSVKWQDHQVLEARWESLRVNLESTAAAQAEYDPEPRSRLRAALSALLADEPDVLEAERAIGAAVLRDHSPEQVQQHAVRYRGTQVARAWASDVLSREGTPDGRGSVFTLEGLVLQCIDWQMETLIPSPYGHPRSDAPTMLMGLAIFRESVDGLMRVERPQPVVRLK